MVTGLRHYPAEPLIHGFFVRAKKISFGPKNALVRTKKNSIRANSYKYISRVFHQQGLHTAILADHDDIRVIITEYLKFRERERERERERDGFGYCFSIQQLISVG